MVGRHAAFGGHADLTILVIEIERFAVFRQMIGTKAANEVMAQFGAAAEKILAPCAIGRVGRATIEVAISCRERAAIDEQLGLIAAALGRRISSNGALFDPRVRFGLARRSVNESEEELLDQASACLSYAADARADRLWAEDVDFAARRDELTLMRDLALAIEQDALQLHYQPKLDTRGNRIASCEALLRWPAAGRPINVERLIRLAEQTGLVRDVTDWALSRAVRDQAALTAAGFDLRVDVNISGMVLPDPAFARRALAVVGDRGRIGFEITETAVIADPDSALANLRQCADRGVRIAIDDYGSGLSSLAYLKQLPAHELKIDRMFVSGLTDSHRDPLLVRSSIDLAHALEMEVTAEGVDNAMALSLLRIMGCDLVQGYIVSPPLPRDALITFLADDAALGALDQPTLSTRLSLRPACGN